MMPPTPPAKNVKPAPIDQVYEGANFLLGYLRGEIVAKGVITAEAWNQAVEATLAYQERVAA